MSDRPDIYFLHIPKTAGTSLAGLIRRAYPEGDSIPAHHWHELLRLSRQDINRYHCYTGHFGTALYSVMDRDLPTVTLLRDPFEQTVSHMRHTMRVTGRNNWLTPTMITAMCRVWQGVKSPGIRRLLEWRYVPILLRDYQTRILGVDVDIAPLLGVVDRRGYPDLVYHAEQGQSREVLLDRAKRRLDSMVVVGTVERFAESVGLICDYLGIPVPPTLPTDNVSQGHSVHTSYRHSGAVSPDWAARIDAITEYDHELYRYANQLLDARLAEKAKVEASRCVGPMSSQGNKSESRS